MWNIQKVGLYVYELIIPTQFTNCAISADFFLLVQILIFDV